MYSPADKRLMSGGDVMAVAVDARSRPAWFRPKYFVFGCIALMMLYVLQHNERFLIDRSNPEWGARLLFFRCGDLVVEIAHLPRDGFGTSDGSGGACERRIETVAGRVDLGTVEGGELRPHQRVMALEEALPLLGTEAERGLG